MSSFSKWRRKARPGPRCRWVPAGLAMNGESGECLAGLDAELAILETFVPRSQFRHYAHLSRADALALFPALGSPVEKPALAHAGAIFSNSSRISPFWARAIQGLIKLTLISSGVTCDQDS